MKYPLLQESQIVNKVLYEQDKIFRKFVEACRDDIPGEFRAKLEAVLQQTKNINEPNEVLDRSMWEFDKDDWKPVCLRDPASFGISSVKSEEISKAVPKKSGVLGRKEDYVGRGFSEDVFLTGVKLPLPAYTELLRFALSSDKDKERENPSFMKLELDKWPVCDLEPAVASPLETYLKLEKETSGFGVGPRGKPRLELRQKYKNVKGTWREAAEESEANKERLDHIQGEREHYETELKKMKERLAAEKK